MTLFPDGFLFLQPGWLLLIPLLFGFLVARRWRPGLFIDAPDAFPEASDGETILARHPMNRLLEAAGKRLAGHQARGLLHVSAIALLAVSLAEPVLVGERLPDPPRERDIVFIVDASIAMVLRDYLVDGERVDRMRMLKGVLDTMIRQLPNDRVGIVVYGENAYTLVPLTRDRPLLRRMLTRIETTVAGRYNAVGEAIALAVRQTLDQATGKPERRRVLVLMTAGGYPTGEIDDFAAATLAAEAGIPLYAVAVGAGSYSAEEERTSGLIYEPADLERLEQLAAVTGAMAFRAGDAPAFVATLEHIEQRETNRRELPPRYVTEPLYHWPLLAAILLLFAGWLSLFVRRGRHA